MVRHVACDAWIVRDRIGRVCVGMEPIGNYTSPGAYILMNMTESDSSDDPDNREERPARQDVPVVADVIGIEVNT